MHTHDWHVPIEVSEDGSVRLLRVRCRTCNAPSPKITKHRWHIPDAGKIEYDAEGNARIGLAVCLCLRCGETKRHGSNPPCFGRPYIIENGKAF